MPNLPDTLALQIPPPHPTNPPTAALGGEQSESAQAIPVTVARAAQVQHPGAGARTSTAQAGELGNVRYEEAFNSARRLIAQHCVGAAGQQKRRNVWADFEAWLSSGVSPRTVESCTPSDIVVYMQLEYLPNHQGSVTASGESCCAPSSVEQVLSHLKACFANEVRRSDRWSTVAEQSGLARGCNPAWSYDVERCSRSHTEAMLSMSCAFGRCLPHQ